LAPLLEIFALILKDIPEAAFIAAGPQDLALPCPGQPEGVSYRERIRQLGLPENRMVFCSFPEDMGPYFHGARLQILPAHYEGLGALIAEAAAYGLPSLVFEGFGTEDIPEHGINGCVIAPDIAPSIEAMAAESIALLSDSRRLEQFRLACESIPGQWSPEAFLGQWDRLIQNVLSLEDPLLLAFLRENHMFPIKSPRAFMRQSFLEYERLLAASKDPAIPSPPPDPREPSPMAAQDPYGAYQELTLMLNSRSWKLTRPLRFLNRVLWHFRHAGFKEALKQLLKK
jgi:hypothetical protein